MTFLRPTGVVFSPVCGYLGLSHALYYRERRASYMLPAYTTGVYHEFLDLLPAAEVGLQVTSTTTWNDWVCVI
jgi:hypothetical protein